MITAPLSKSELIANWCHRLGDAFGKNVRDGLVAIWQENLAAFDSWVLEKSFVFIEKNDEKFPTLSRTLKVCRENKPYEGSGTDYDNTAKFTKTQDKEGRPCILDLENREMLYRAEDCPEGQEFLELLRKMGMKADKLFGGERA